jgi:hypothetical protein
VVVVVDECRECITGSHTMRAKIAVSPFLSIAVVVVLLSLSLSFRIGSSTGKETASRYSERAWVDLEVGEVGGEMKV